MPFVVRRANRGRGPVVRLVGCVVARGEAAIARQPLSRRGPNLDLAAAPFRRRVCFARWPRLAFGGVVLGNLGRHFRSVTFCSVTALGFGGVVLGNLAADHVPRVGLVVGHPLQQHPGSSSGYLPPPPLLSLAPFPPVSLARSLARSLALVFRS